jgi:hypothetical protein
VRKLNILVAGLLTALAIVAIGCGGSGETDPEVSVPEHNPEVASPGGGLVPLNRFLEFDGQRYVLTLELHEGMVEDSEFSPIGEAASVDIPLPGGNTVFERESDPDAVYTLSPATADDGEIWLRWAKS